MQLYLADGATHTDTHTHTDENKTQVNSKEPRSQGERRAGVTAQLGTCTLEGGCSMVWHLPMVVQLGPQSHAWGSCPRRDPSRAERSLRVGIRVADRTQRETRSGRVSSVVIGIDQTDHSTNEERPCTTTHRLMKKLSVCQSFSYTKLMTPAKLQRMPQ